MTVQATWLKFNLYDVLNMYLWKKFCGYCGVYQQGEDPIVRKYLLMGLSKEAVIAALKTYGDLQNKVGSVMSTLYCHFSIISGFDSPPYLCTLLWMVPAWR